MAFTFQTHVDWDDNPAHHYPPKSQLDPNNPAHRQFFIKAADMQAVENLFLNGFLISGGGLITGVKFNLDMDMHDILHVHAISYGPSSLHSQFDENVGLKIYGDIINIEMPTVEFKYNNELGDPIYVMDCCALVYNDIIYNQVVGDEMISLVNGQLYSGCVFLNIANPDLGGEHGNLEIVPILIPSYKHPYSEPQELSFFIRGLQLSLIDGIDNIDAVLVTNDKGAKMTFLTHGEITHNLAYGADKVIYGLFQSDGHGTYTMKSVEELEAEGVTLWGGDGVGGERHTYSPAGLGLGKTESDFSILEGNSNFISVKNSNISQYSARVLDYYEPSIIYDGLQEPAIDIGMAYAELSSYDPDGYRALFLCCAIEKDLGGGETRVGNS